MVQQSKAVKMTKCPIILRIFAIPDTHVNPYGRYQLDLKERLQLEQPPVKQGFEEGSCDQVTDRQKPY
jgi:hypothetical protein